MKNKLALFGLCAFACGVMTASAATSRVWTDTSGRKVEATFIKLEGDTVYIQLATGQVFPLPLAKLSPEDQQIAKTLPPAENASAMLSVPTNASAAQAAAKIDQLVQQGLAVANQKLGQTYQQQLAKDPKTPKPAALKANAPMSDEQFVRRAYLDIAGRIPSYQETTDFLKNGAADKRMKLIDTLLDSDGYVSHTFNYFAEMLRMIDRFDGNGGYVRGLPYIQWFKEQIKLDQQGKTSWDKIVYAMLTADGKAWTNPATGYLLRDSGMPLDNLANTLTVFLGTDVACAQCHDHPFTDWTQRQFYEMAAFFGATSTRYNGKKQGGSAMMGGDKSLVEEAAQLASSNGGVDPKQIRNLIGNVVGANRYMVSDLDKNGMKLPHDYKYKDGSPNEPVTPKLIMWSEDDKRNPAYADVNKTIKKTKKTPTGEVKDAEDLRAKFASWATHPANPRFAMTIANRMWQRAFGAALTPTVKNIDNPDEAYNPPLLKHLASEMVRVKFNIKIHAHHLQHEDLPERGHHRRDRHGDALLLPGASAAPHVGRAGVGFVHDARVGQRCRQVQEHGS